MSTKQLDTFLHGALAAARRAGDVLLRRRGQVAVEYKAGFSDLVTAADREAEHVVIDELRQRFPSCGVIGEETGVLPGSAPTRWLVDPLDGTTNYAQGLPLFGTSIGLESEGELLVGVIHLPALGETYTAVRGAGARRNGEKLRVSDATELTRALLVTGFAHALDFDARRNNLSLLAALSERSRGVRMLGSAAVNLAYVAAGVLDAYWAPENEVWDVAAGVLLVREAGGRVTAMDGGPFDLFRPNLLATNGALHGKMVDALANRRTD